jgi:hypothetical protein
MTTAIKEKKQTIDEVAGKYGEEKEAGSWLAF